MPNSVVDWSQISATPPPADTGSKTVDWSQISAAPSQPEVRPKTGPQLQLPEDVLPEYQKPKGPAIIPSERFDLHERTTEPTFQEARQMAAQQVSKAVDENLPFLVGPFRFHAGAIKAAATAATDPVTLAVTAATAGLSNVPGVAARVLETGLSAYFATEAGKNFIEKVPEIKKSVETGDWQKAAEIGGGTLADAVIATASANHVKSQWGRMFDSIEAHNAAAGAALETEQAAGKSSSEAGYLAQKIVGDQGIEVQIGGKPFTVRAGEPNYAPDTAPSARKPIYEVVDAKGKVVRSGSGQEIGDYLGTKNAQRADTEPTTPENLDARYSDIVAERAEAQSAADKAKAAGKRDLYAEAVMKDADARLSDVQKQRAQFGAPGTQLPQPVVPEPEGPTSEAEAPVSETKAPTFETRAISPEDVKHGVAFQDKVGRTFTVQSVGKSGRVTFVGEDGEKSILNTPAQFAGRMTAIAVSQGIPNSPNESQIIPGNPTEAAFAPEDLKPAAPVAAPAAESVAPAPVAPESVPAQSPPVLPAEAIPAAPLTDKGEGNALHLQKLENAADAAAPVAVPTTISSDTEQRLSTSSPTLAPAEPAIAPQTPVAETTPAPTEETPEPQFHWQQPSAESELPHEEHKAEVVDAIRRGEDVPPEVRADHRDVDEEGEERPNAWKGAAEPSWWKTAYGSKVKEPWEVVRDAYLNRLKDNGYSQTMMDYAQDWGENRAEAGFDRRAYEAGNPSSAQPAQEGVIQSAPEGAPPSSAESTTIKGEENGIRPGTGDREASLEAIPAADVRGDAEEGDSGPGGESRDRDHGERDRGSSAGGPAAERGEGGVHGAVGVPAGGERPAAPGREPEPARTDYHITDADEIGKGTVRQKAIDNVAAIRVLKSIEAEDRNATPAEQAVLAKYVGWGGMPQIFEPVYRVPREWAGIREDLENLLTAEEFTSARASTPNAHYTSPMVVKAMWDAMRHIGIVKPGDKASVLEPSMGVGIFFGLEPSEDAAGAQRVGVELDSITGRIAQQLYPKADIHVTGFEKARLPSNYFDLAIGNVPFGNYGIHDPAFKRTPLVTRSIHDYFFAKGLDRVRPGGVVAFITSSYTMDKKDSAMRKYLADHADLIGAIRLPNTAFKGNAGTEVTTDIIILKKRAPQTEAQGETWTKLEDYKSADGPMQINEYYAHHPEMMLGKMGLQGSMYAEKSAALTGELTPEKLAAAVSLLPENVVGPARAEDRPAFDTLSAMAEAGDVKEGAFTVKDGVVMIREGDKLIPAGMNVEQASRVKGLINLRDAVRSVFRSQINDAPDSEIKAAQKKLNEFYDAFVSKYGPVHQVKNARAFQDDPDAPLILSLENWDKDTQKHSKTAIFSQRTIDKYRPVEKSDSARDALSVSLNEKGRLDWTRMQELTGKTPAELREELGTLVYQNPDGKQWETADAYLSGNVRRKLADAEAASRMDHSYARNVEALKAIQPVDLEPHEINGRLGSAWIPKGDVQQFVSELLGIPFNNVIIGHAEALGSWSVTLAGNSKAVVANTQTWGTKRFYGHDLIQDALNVKNPTAYDTIEGGKTVVNETETTAAREVQQRIKEEFASWLWKSPERATRLSRSYNDDFNNLRLREYDGSHLTFPGMAVGLTLRAHQKNGVWRQLQSGNTLLAHVVGAGKTLEIIAGAMEMRRIGLAKKPTVVVPKNRVAGTADEWLKAYPAANILTMSSEDFTAKNRQRMMARIGTGNWDGVIVSYESFERLPISDETFNAHLQTQIDQLEDYIRSSKGEKADARMVKELEKAKKRLEAKIRNNEAGIARDRSVNFEDLGIDALFVDEADNFKNLYFPTKMTRIAGIPNSESKRAFDMYIKTQYVNKKNGGERGIVFATGTPIANTMAEMYTMQRYLQPKWLEEHGLSHFDAWAQTFGEVRPSLESTTDSTGLRVVNRFSKFVNIPELSAGFRLMADVQTADMLKLPVPALKGGKASVIPAPASDAQRAYLHKLAARAKAIKEKKVKPKEDNMLNIATDGRKAALDIRLVDPAAPDHPSSKVNRAVDNIYRIWEETKKDSLTQLVFLDFSRPADANESRFTVSDDLKFKLMKMGIPAKEVVFIHEADTDEQKEKLFKAVNEGKVRIVIGSTQKMGVGLNVQKKLYALHHLDAPWRPRDIEQREGRILRQGNTNPEVLINIYVTEPSFDANMWGGLRNKAAFITQVMRGDVSVRTAEDVSETVLNYAEIAAISSGNPAIREKAMVDAEVRKLDSLRSRHDQIQYQVIRDSATIPGEIAGAKRIQSSLAEDIATVEKHKPEFIIGKKTISGEGMRKAADEAINAIRDKHRGDLSLVRFGNESFEPLVIGSYRGLKIEIFYSFASSISTDENGKPSMPSVQLRGRQTYETEGTAASIEASAASKPDTRKRGIEQQIATAEKKLTDSQALIGKKFEQQDKLEKALARQSELEKELQTNQEDPQVDAGEGQQDPVEQAQEAAERIAPELVKGGRISSYKPSSRKIKAPSGGWMRIETTDGRKVSSDGHYAVVAEIEPSNDSLKLNPETFTNSIFVKPEGALPVEAAAWDGSQKTDDKKPLTVVWFSDKTAVDARYYDDLTRRYPDATFVHDNLALGGAKSGVFAEVDGKVVGVIMPLRIQPSKIVAPILDPSRAGGISLEFLTLGLSNLFGKKADKVDYQAFGDEESVKDDYDYLASLKSTFGTGDRLSQVRMASPEAWKALVKMAATDSVTRVTIRRAELDMNKALENTPIDLEKLIRYYSESRLQGIRDRWNDLAQQATDMSNEELEKSFSNDFMLLLEAIENKRGLPQNIRQTSEALATRGDWATLRDFLAQTFGDAARLVATLMDDDEFEYIKDLVSGNDGVAEADRVYSNSIESLMAEYHAEHEGVMASALGPANRYVPLTGILPENVKGRGYQGIRRAFKKPPNQRNVLATGISRLGYDTTLEALEKGLTGAVRASSKHQAIEAMENAGMLKKFRGKAPDTFRFQGQLYPSHTIEVSPSRTMLIKEGGKTRVIHMPAQMMVTAQWIYKEVKPILDADKLTESSIQRVLSFVNGAAIFGPTLAIIDSHNILSTLTANTPFLGATLAEKGLSAPLLKKISAVVMLIRTDPMTQEAYEDLTHMAKIGALPQKYGAKTWGKKLAEKSGAEQVKWWDSTPFLYGPKGVDVRGRLLMYRIAKALNPDASDLELHDFINQIGTYVPGLQSSVESWFKKYGLSPFFTRGAQMIINGFHTFSGTGPMPKKGIEMRIAQMVTGGAIALIGIWLAVSKMVGWKPVGLLKSEVNIPQHVRQSAIGKQLGWDKRGTMVIDFTLFNALVARGARSMGLLAAVDTLMAGGKWWQAVEYGTTQAGSTLFQPAIGPVVRMALVGVFGVQPYLTAQRDRHGVLGPQFFPAVPTRHSGLQSFGERGLAAVLSANAMESQLGQASGFMGIDQNDKGSHYLQMISDLAWPGANPKAVNLYSRQQMLRQQRTGTK